MSNDKMIRLYRFLAAIIFWSLILLLFLFFYKMSSIEPIEGDGWNVATSYKQHGANFTQVLNTLKYYHYHGNPRIGILFFIIAYYAPPIPQLMASVAIVLLFVTLFAIAFGRRPHPTNPRDSYLLLVLIALCWLVTPNVGQTFFYRPITTNYIYGFLCTIAFFLPFRFYLASHHDPSRFWWVLAIIMPIFGIFVGKCNEHTGPTAILVAVGFTALATKKREIKPLAWMFSGSVGLIIGYLLLFFAPGQEKRYEGLGNESLFTTLGKRGWIGNLELLWGFFRDTDALFMFVCGILLLSSFTKDKTFFTRLRTQRSRCEQAAIYIFFALSVLITSLAAPLHFWRLTIASVFLLLVATLIIVDVFSVDRKLIAAVSIFAIITNIAFAHRSITFYTELNNAYKNRVALFKNKGSNDIVQVPLYPVNKESSMYWGDSLAKGGRYIKSMARYFGVRGIIRVK